MAQNAVFEQIIKLIPRTIFQAMVARHDADKGLRTLDSWTWFGSLLFGQLTGHDSISAIERVFAHSDSKMQRLGFGIGIFLGRTLEKRFSDFEFWRTDPPLCPRCSNVI